MRDPLPPDLEASEPKRHALELNHRYVMPGRVESFVSWGVPLVMGRREGYCIWDLDGHRLIDIHLNGGVFNLGHRNPELIETLRDSLDEVDIGNHHFPSKVRGELAERLAALAPGSLRYTVFASGGSEASDIAIKSARRATGRRKIVGIDAGYHGRTGLSGAAGDDSAARYFLSDSPEQFVTVPFNDLEAMERALSPGDVAAVLIETIPATCGFPVPQEGYLPGVAELCRRYGALYVADEVQTGLGRTGPLWAVERYGVEPDILVIGKGLSGGVYPVAATLLGESCGEWLHDNGWGHVSTFGGSEVGCRVALKVLEITTRDETRANAGRVAEHLARGFAEIRSREPFLKGVRQQGLVMGLEFDGKAGALQMLKPLYEHGVWAMFAGFDPAVLQCKPGLLIDLGLCDELLERFESAVRAAGGRKEEAHAGAA
jgi:acetylornithine/succinyldiaminopimelate/putrescine aminotransferase